MNDDWRIIAVATGVAYLVSVVITRMMAVNHVITDIPNYRSSHQIPTPRSGGIGILIGFMLVSVIYAYYYWGKLPTWFLPFVIPSVFIGIHGLFDDIYNRPALEKLVIQLIAAGVVVFAGVVLDLPFGGEVLSMSVTMLWICGLTNAANFMDGLDGLMAGIFSLAFVFFCMIMSSIGQYDLYLFGMSIMAGLMGFLIYNFPPAKIFMGDVGSCLIGFAYAVMVVIAYAAMPSLWVLVASVMLVFNLLFDVIFTLSRRLLKGENVLKPHRSHLFQLLNRLGFGHLSVSMYYLVVSLFQGLLAWWVLNTSGKTVWMALAILVVWHIGYTLLVMRAVKRNQILL